jgi:hypothetical protein
MIKTILRLPSVKEEPGYPRSTLYLRICPTASPFFMKHSPPRRLDVWQNDLTFITPKHGSGDFLTGATGFLIARREADKGSCELSTARRRSLDGFCAPDDTREYAPNVCCDAPTTPLESPAARRGSSLRPDRARVSGAPVFLRLSGEFLQVSGTLLRLSGEFLQVSGGLLRLSGEFLQVSGSLLRFSGEFLQGVAVPLSGLSYNRSIALKSIDPILLTSPAPRQDASWLCCRHMCSSYLKIFAKLGQIIGTVFSAAKSVSPSLQPRAPPDTVGSVLLSYVMFFFFFNFMIQGVML